MGGERYNHSLLQKAIHIQKENAIPDETVVIIFHMFASSKLFTAAEMYDVIFGKWSADEVTILFTLWRTIWNVPNPALMIESDCTVKNFLAAVGKRLHPSQRLLRDAKNYEKLYLNSRNSLAVMIRSEHSVRMLEKSVNGSVTIDSCLQKTLKVTRNLQRKLWSYDVFTTVDVGMFASGSWGQTLSHFNYSLEDISGTIQAVKDAVEELHKTNVPSKNGKRVSPRPLVGYKTGATLQHYRGQLPAGQTVSS